MLAHERLELGERQPAPLIPGTQAANRGKAALVNAAVRCPNVNHPAHQALAEPTGRDPIFQLGNSIVQQFTMQRRLSGFAVRALIRRIDPDRRLQRG